MGVVAETMVALVLADEALRKFGGDSLAELVAQRRRPTTRPTLPRWVSRGRAGRHRRARRDDGRRARPTVGRRLAERARPAVRRRDEHGRGARRGAPCARSVRPTGEAAFRRGGDRGARPTLVGRADAGWSSPPAGARSLRAGQPRAAARRRLRGVAAGRRRRCWSARADGDHRPAARRRPAGVLARLAAERGAALPRGRRRGRRRRRVHVGDDEPERRWPVASPRWCPRRSRRDGRGRRSSSRSRAPGGRLRRSLVGAGARRRAGRRARRPGPGGSRSSPRPAIAVDVDPGVEHRVVPRSATARRPSRWPRSRSCAAPSPRWGLTRADCVVAVGRRPRHRRRPASRPPSTTGASPVVHVPTTLLGQIDAAIGGKTGVNLPEGKNLVGAFWQPAAVLCDTEVLATLPPRECRSGLGEMAKYHFLDRRRPAGAAARRAGRRVRAHQGRRWWRPTSARSGAPGAPRSTTATPSPTPSRSPARYDLRHGEAVAIGLVYAAELARRLGRIDDARVAEHRAGRGRLRPAADAAGRRSTPTRSCALMARDKKALDGAHVRARRTRRRRGGRRGPEVGRRRSRRWPVMATGGAGVSRSPDRAAAPRAQPEPAGRAASPRSTAPRRSPTTSTPPGPRRRPPGSTSSTSSPTTRATWSTPSTAARGRCAAIVINPGRVHPLRLGAPRRAGRLRRAGRRAAPVEPPAPRGRGATPRWSPRWPPGPSSGSAATATGWRSRRSPALLGTA